MSPLRSKPTHFGFEQVDEEEKADRVAGVFDSVASRYDLMNDVMSAGLHRVWKAFTVRHANVRPGMKVLDIAGGTGDLAKAFAKSAGATGEVWLTDINGSMLAEGRDRLLDAGLDLPLAQCDAEKLPFASGHFDRVSVAFGLRNMTHKDIALVEMARVLRPGGNCWCWSFPAFGGRLLLCTMPTRSTCCPGWAGNLPATATVTATSRNRFACIRRRMNSRR